MTTFAVSAADSGTPGDELLARAVRAAAVPIICHDPTGIVLTWNAAAEQLYGRSAAEMIGKPWGDLAPAQCRSELDAARARAMAGETVGRLDSVHLRGDGSRIAVAVSMAPVRDATGAVEAVITTVVDHGAALLSPLELVDGRAELARTRDALRRAYRELHHLASVARRELSEPVHLLTGYAEQLDQHHTHGLDEQGRRYLRHVREAGARLQTLVDDLLAYSRVLLAAGEPAPHDAAPVDADAVARRVARAVAREPLAAGGNIEIGPLPSVLADEAKLAILLQTLLTNAIMFASPGRPPQVVVTASDHEGWVTLRVDDNGTGILPQHRDSVFGTLEGLSEHGTGSGLAVARRIVEQAGGKIWVQDSPLGGARVCCTLPSTSRPAS